MESSLISELNDLLSIEEDFWALKSRTNWLFDGDRNTRFFHLTTIERRRANKILALKDPLGAWNYEESMIKHILISHFSSLFTTSKLSVSRDFSTQLLFPTIPSSAHGALSATPLLAELKSVVWSFKPWKSPRPDGLHPGFFQKSWEITGNSILVVIRDIFATGLIPSPINHTFLCLIPKDKSPETVHHFRPISLCNTILKILSKALVTRIRPFLRDLISPFQSSFLAGRSGMDNVIIVQEVIHRFRSFKGSKGAMIIKLDLEKAFDRLKWDFIRKVLTFFNFPPLWIGIIMSIVSTSSLSILLNGNVTDTFHPTRGIRQGDSLSPYIFILCLEYLSLQISAACEAKDWIPFKLSRRGPFLSHLFFADDLVLFARATEANCDCITSILDEFCSISGQKVNLSKSRVLFSSNTPPVTATSLANKLGIPLTNHFGKYLGCPIHHSRPTKQSFQFIVEKIEKRIASWNNKQLPFASRKTLINSIVETFPSHVMHCNFLPITTLKSIDRLSRDFLWGSTRDRRKLHAVNWCNVTKGKKFGGLGIRSMQKVNLVSMAKLSWRLHQDDHSLWARVLRGRYNISHPNNSNCSSTWRGIQKGHSLLLRGSRSLIGDGSSTSFWFDNWTGDGPLRSLIEGPLNWKEDEVLVRDC